MYKMEIVYQGSFILPLQQVILHLLLWVQDKQSEMCVLESHVGEFSQNVL